MSSLALLPEEIIKRKIVSLPPHTPSEFFLSGAIPNCLTRWEHVRIAILSAQVLIAGEFKGAIRRLVGNPAVRISKGGAMAADIHRYQVHCWSIEADLCAR